MSTNEKNNLKLLREVVARNNYMIFDTETTGLKSEAEIVQIAVWCSQWGGLIDSLIRPTKPIPPEATAVHHITTEIAERDGHQWSRVYLNLMDMIELFNFDIISYNLDYDSRMMVQTCKHHGVDSVRWLNHTRKVMGACAMLAYAEHRGIINPRFGTYTWHKLSEAAMQEGITVKNAHAAMGDVLMTAELCQKMAKE